MFKKILTTVLSAIFLFTMNTAVFAEDKWDNLLVESAKVFEDMTKMPDEGIPVSLLKDSYAIVIIPSAIGGGFVFGGRYGQGVIVSRDKKNNNKWSAPAVYQLAGASWGLQIGGQATDIILLVMSERGLDGLVQSQFKLGGDAAVSAGPVGRDAAAATDLQLKGGILSYSRSRGLFAGVKLEGTILSFHTEANTKIYGKDVTARDVLINKTVQPTKAAERLLKDLGKY